MKPWEAILKKKKNKRTHRTFQPNLLHVTTSTHSSKIAAASWHSATLELYPGLLDNACFTPEKANKIL